MQIGFVETTIEAIKAGTLPPSALREVVFLQQQRRWLPNENGWKRLDRDKAQDTAVQFRRQNLAALESITPEDLARSDKLEWLYVIKNSLVYQVKSYDEAKQLIEGEQIAIHTEPAPKPPGEDIPPAAIPPLDDPVVQEPAVPAHAADATPVPAPTPATAPAPAGQPAATEQKESTP